MILNHSLLETEICKAYRSLCEGLCSLGPRLTDGDIPENLTKPTSRGVPSLTLEASAGRRAGPGFHLLPSRDRGARCTKGDITLEVLRTWTEMNLTATALFWGDLAISPRNLVNVFFFFFHMNRAFLDTKRIISHKFQRLK